MDDGGVERHHLVERVGKLRRRVLEMLVEPRLSRRPRRRVTLGQLVAEVGPHQRVRVEDGRVGQQAAVVQVRQGQLPVLLTHADETFVELRNHRLGAKRDDSVAVRGTVEES